MATETCKRPRTSGSRARDEETEHGNRNQAVHQELLQDSASGVAGNASGLVDQGEAVARPKTQGLSRPLPRGPLLPVPKLPALPPTPPNLPATQHAQLPWGLQHCAKASSQARAVRGRGQVYASQSYLRSWDLNEPGQRLENLETDPKVAQILRALRPFELRTSEDSCAICYEPMQGKLVRQLPCMHVFHATCIARWLRIRHCCPLDKWDVESVLHAESTSHDAHTLQPEEPDSRSPRSSPHSSPLYQPSRSPSPDLRKRSQVSEAASEPLLLVE